jgi:hypothetical protein
MCLGEKRNSSYSFTTSALDGGEWSVSRPGRALRPGIGSPVPTVQEAGWAPEPIWTQSLEPLPGIEPRSPGRPLRSQTLYWLSYPGSYWYIYQVKILLYAWPMFAYLQVLYCTKQLAGKLWRVIKLLSLQVGGWAWDWKPHNVKIIITEPKRQARALTES